MLVTFEQVSGLEEVRTYIVRADISLKALGYTEHSFPHLGRVVSTAGGLLRELGYSQRTVELTKIAAFMHDIGNVVNRADHAQTGAIMAFRILDKLGMPADELARVISAIGNHDEGTAFPVNELAAALILADKTDVRRSRVRNQKPETFDIHDRVNYAVLDSSTSLDKEGRVFLHNLTLDTGISPVLDYFEIFMQRLLLCRKAAEFFGLRFSLAANGSVIY